MKILPRLGRAIRNWVPALALVFALLQPGVAQESPDPRITAIDVSGDQLVISALAPAHVVRLVLEGAERGELRAWRPRAVQRVTAPGTVTFSLPLNLAAQLRVEMFRVRADTNDPLPAAFYTGKTQYAGEPAPAGSPVLYRGENGAEWLVANGAPNVPATPTPTPDAGKDASRNVAESDIWRVHGNRLYFFNHQRGLQIVDITHPDTPTLLATHPLPASGEQMYLLDDRHVVLLARSHPCDDAWGQNATSAVILLDVSNDVPRETARIPVEGRILESRIVGTALYVATDTWSPKSNLPEDAGVWVNGTRITGIDLANPAQPLARNSLWIAGSGNVVTATDRFLLVGVQAFDSKRWWDSQLHLIDIRDPAGSLTEFNATTLNGRLQDKFKVAIHGDILTAITAGPANADGSGNWRSVLTNYRLVEPSDPSLKPAIQRLGAVEVGHGEQLYATRFDGSRAYLVTFRQIDPLWIIDLSVPESPRVLGELEIPGWSSYIHPMGDRLLTVGFDTTGGLRAAVQLFDVANPAKPALLSKVPLGREWSWSEANSDEKALGVFPDAGLVLVPFTSSGANQQISGVQVIDLGRDSLAARGRIDSKNVVPRRATLSGNRVLAVSSRDLVAVSITDRDHPEIKGRLELSYPVDRVVPVGPWLVEFSEFHLRTRATDTPGQTRGVYDLAAYPVIGAEVRNDRLYVLQARPTESVWQNELWITNTPPGLKLTVFDTSVLPKLTPIGSVLQSVESDVYGDFEAHWPQPHVVVWSPISPNSWWGPWLFLRGGPDVINVQPMPAVAAPATTDAAPAPLLVGATKPGGGAFVDPAILPVGRWWNPTPPTFLAFDVSDPAQPKFASSTRGPENTWSPSRAHTANGLIYFSHDTQESRITGTNSYAVVIAEPVVTNRVYQVTNIVQVPYDTIVTNLYSKEFSVTSWVVSSPLLGSAQAGVLHAVGLDAAGRAYGWGDNRAGQLGSFAAVNSDTPMPIPFPSAASSLAAAKWFTLARLTDGSVWMAGAPLGPDGPPLPFDPAGTTPANPVQPISGLPSDISEVAAGYHHALARSTSGSVFAWGLNDRGQLGTGDDSDHPTPTAITLPSPVVSIVGGGLHSLAVTADGLVLGWGDNEKNQLSAVGEDRVLSPRAIPGLTGIRSAAAGDYHSLALDQSQTVWAWGEAYEGNPGAGAPPQPVSGLPPIRAIAAGRHHSVALDVNGNLWSWGSHAYEPYLIRSTEPIQSISARGSYAIANSTTGKTYLWQLDDYPTPTAGYKTAFIFSSLTRTNVEPGVLFRFETNIVTKTVQETYWVERTVTNSYPVFEYTTHHHLSVIDYSVDAANPVVRPPVSIPGTLEGLSHAGALLYTVATRSDAEPKNPTRTWLEASAYDGTAAHFVTGIEIANVSKNGSAIVEIDAAGNLWVAQSDNEKTHTLSRLRLDESGTFQAVAKSSLSSVAHSLGHIGQTLSVSLQGTARLYGISPSGEIVPRSQPFDLGCLLPSLDRIAGDTTTGFWAPLGDFGSAPLSP